MKKGRRSTTAFGIHFGSCSIRLVILERTRKGIQLKQCLERPLPNGLRFAGTFDPHIKNAIIQNLQSLLSDIRTETEKVTVGLDSRNVIIRRTPVDSWLEEKELHDQVLWEAEQLLVDPLDHYLLDFHIQDVDETVREVLLVAARRTTVEEYTDILHKSGIYPFCVDVDLFALSNAHEFLSGRRPNGTVALVDVEPDSVRCVIMHNGLLYFGKRFEMVPQAVELGEVLKTATSRSGETLPLKRIVLSGSETLSEAFFSDLSATCPYSIETAELPRSMKTGSSLSRQQFQRHISSYMIGLGLALRGITET